MKIGVVIVYCVEEDFKFKFINVYIKMNSMNIFGFVRFRVCNRVVLLIVKIVFRLVYLKKVMNCVVKKISIMYIFIEFMFLFMVLMIFLLFFIVLIIWL